MVHYLSKEERSQIKSLNLHTKELEKEKTKFNISRRRKSEVREMKIENKKVK